MLSEEKHQNDRKLYHQIYTSALNELREQAKKRKKSNEKKTKMPKISRNSI